MLDAPPSISNLDNLPCVNGGLQVSTCETCGFLNGILCERISYDIPPEDNGAAPTNPGGLEVAMGFGCVLHQPCRACARRSLVDLGVRLYSWMEQVDAKHTCKEGT